MRRRESGSHTSTSGARFSAKLLRRVLVTDGADYRAWVRGCSKRRGREHDERHLTELIFEVHAAHPAHGALRVMRELQRQGVPVGRRIVARLMRDHGIAGITRLKRRNLTKPDAGASAVPDLIRRRFTAPMPGLKLVGGIGCFRPVRDGCTYKLRGIRAGSAQPAEGRPHLRRFHS